MDIKIDNKLIISALILFMLIIVGVKQYGVADKFKEEPKEKEAEKMDTIGLKIIINDKKYSATLFLNETTKELMKKLPLEIEMKELNNNEKYYYFEDKLSSMPMDIEKINKGDIMLFSDNCLVIFYKTFNTKYAYTKLGSIDNIDEFELNEDDIKVRIEK